MLKLLIDLLFPTHFTETLVAERNRRMKAVRLKKPRRETKIALASDPKTV